MKHVFALTAFVLALLMHAAFVPAQDMAAPKPPPGNPLRFQTQGLQATADAGESGASSFTRAIIQVQALADGVPVEDLGPFGFTGNETTVISLPSGWSIETLTVGPGGCVMVPTMFTHPAFGLGIYSISVVPYTANPACVWQRGTYSYVVTYNDGRRIGTARLDHDPVMLGGAARSRGAPPPPSDPVCAADSATCRFRCDEAPSNVAQAATPS